MSREIEIRSRIRDLKEEAARVAGRMHGRNEVLSASMPGAVSEQELDTSYLASIAAKVELAVAELDLALATEGPRKAPAFERTDHP